MTFNAEQFLKENPKPWDWETAIDDGSFAVNAEQNTIAIEKILAYIEHLEAENTKLGNEAIDRKMQLRSLECVSKALEKVVSDHGETIANTVKCLKDQILPKVEALEAENARLKPLAEVGELVNRLPELIENCKIEHYPNTESWLVSDGGGCLSPRRYHSKQILEALREAFGEVG